MFPPFPGSRARQQSFLSVLLRRLSRQNIPAPSDGVELFARRLAGRFMPAAVGPSNLPFVFQPYVGGNKFALASASGSSATTITTIGMPAPSATGTATARALALTNLLTSTRRVGYVLASAAVNLATGWTLNNAGAVRGNAAGLGGFFYHARFGFAALTAGNRHMIGFTSLATTTGDPSAAVNCAIIGKDAADTNFQVMVNDASGTATKVDTGIVPAIDKLYDVFIFAPPNGNSIKFALLSYDTTGRVDASFEHEAFADLPDSSTYIFQRVLSGSGTATTGAQIDILQTYAETDF